VKPKVILRPLTLSFLLIFSIKVLRSFAGLSVLVFLAVLGVMKISLQINCVPDKIIAYREVLKPDGSN
jgi:hypothetical protein